MQMPTIETRVASLEAVQAQINERLGNIEQGQRERFASIENRLTSIDNRQNSNFRWIVGLLVTVLLANIGTTISIIIALSRQ